MKEHLVKVVFENRYYGLGSEIPRWQNKEYTYKTQKLYNVGDIISIANSQFGANRAIVVNSSVDPNTIDFDINLLKEIF